MRLLHAQTVPFDPVVLSAVLDSLPYHIAILDVNGVILGVNERWRRFGRDNGARQDEVGENYLDVCDRASGEGMKWPRGIAKGIRLVRDGDREQWTMEYPCHSPTEKRWFVARVARIQDAGGRAALVVAHENVSERRLRDEERAKAEEALEAAEELRQEKALREQLLNVALHEAKNPLTPLAMNLDLVKMDADEGLATLPAETRQRLDSMRRNIDAVVRSLNDARDMAKAQSGRLDVRAEMTDISGLLREAAADAEAACAPKAIALRLDVTPGLLGQADPQRTRQVIANLIGNAAKFTPAQGTVTLRAVEAGGRIEISVRDSGVGLTREQHAKLFQPFGMAHARDVDATGTGLGLYICKSIVEAQGGTILAQSDGAGQGTVFTFTVPQ